MQALKGRGAYFGNTLYIFRKLFFMELQVLGACSIYSRLSRSFLFFFRKYLKYQS